MGRLRRQDLCRLSVLSQPRSFCRCPRTSQVKIGPEGWRTVASKALCLGQRIRLLRHARPFGLVLP